MQTISLNFIFFLKTMVAYPQTDIQDLAFKMEGVNYYRNVFHLTCCSGPKSDSDLSLKSFIQNSLFISVGLLHTPNSNN